MIEYVSSWFTPTVLFCVLNLMIGTIFISSSLKPQKQQHQLGHLDDSPHLARVPSLLDRVRSINYSFRRDHPVFDPFSYAQNAPPLARAPSLLERFTTMSLSFSRPEQPHGYQGTTHYADPPENETRNNPSLARAPSLLERVGSFKFSFSRAEKPGPAQSTVHYADPPEGRIQKVEAGDSETETQPRRSKSATCAEIPVEDEKKQMKKSASAKLAAEETEDDVDRRRPATVREKKWKWSETAGTFEEDEAVDRKADDFINRFKQQLKLQRLDSLLRYKEALHRRVG